MGESPQKKPLVFISYAHEDKAHVKQLADVMGRLSRGQVEVFYDKKMEANPKWQKVIADKIASSYVYVSLVSKDFFESEPCRDEAYELAKCDPVLFTLCVEPVPEDTSIHLRFGPIIGVPNIVRLNSVEDGLYKETVECTYEKFASSILTSLNIRHKVGVVSLSDYSDEIDRGYFTPVIGPGCNGLEGEWDEDQKRCLQERLHQLEERLENDTFRHFVRASLSTRAPKFCATLYDFSSDIFPYRKMMHVVVDVSDRLVSLRAAIARAGAAASRLIGMSLSQCAGLVDARSLKVEIALEDTQLKSDIDLFRKSLVEIIKHSFLFSKHYLKNDGCKHNLGFKACFAANKIHKKIKLLYNIIFNKSKPSEVVKSKTIDLTLAQLDWLSDLLWYTLRFDVLVLPRSEELAFQISLCKSDQCVSSMPLCDVAVVSCYNRDDYSYSKCISRIYKSVAMEKEERGKGWSPFYRTMARMLRFAFDKHSSSRSSDDPYLVMAITENLDCELENCLFEVSHSVIFPVMAIFNSQHKESRVAWLLQVYDKELKSINKNKYYLVGVDNANPAAILKKIKGPLIVKMRGSVGEMPSDDLLPPVISAVEHAFFPDSLSSNPLISSLDFLRQALGLKIVEPNFLNAQLSHHNRIFGYFGYPLDDFDGLFGFQRNVWIVSNEKESNSNPKNSKISVGCVREDGFTDAFLNAMNVSPLIEDMDGVAIEIDAILDTLTEPSGKEG